MITGQERFKYKDLLNMVNEMLGNNITIKYTAGGKCYGIFT